MKKNGFTLAEVLITLGIIGVVAAITLPSLMTDTTSAQVGPKLAKAVSMFEQANETLLNANSVDTLSDAGLLDDINAYGTELENYLKISKAEDGKYLSKDGMEYNFTISNSAPLSTVAPHKQRIGEVMIDINAQAKPNEAASDQFYFSWWNDGSLRPKGASNWDDSGSATTWRTKCPADAAPADADAATYCAGHVFENNLKVLYK